MNYAHKACGKHARSSPAVVRQLWLVVSSLLLSVMQPAAAQQPALVVCTSPRPPFIFYNDTTQLITGYEWDLFNLVASSLSLNFTTRVLPWSDMMSNLMLPPSDPSRCDIAAASIPLTFHVSSAAGSLKYSIPTFRSGYAIVTSVEWNPFDMWSFGRVFSNQLWVVLLATASILSVLTYLAERDFTVRGLGKTKYPVPLKPGMYEAVYNCVGKLFNIVQDLKVTSLPGKLLSLAWGFLVLVVISMYTGVVAALLTSTTWVTGVQGLSDLQSGAFDTISATNLVSNFTKQGFTPRGVPFSTQEQQQAALNLVASGGADAIVAEYPWLKYQVEARCDLVVVGSMFKYVSNVILFSPSTSDSFVYQVNSQLTYQQAQGMYEILQAAYIKTQNVGSCTTTSYVITLKQLEGLWYIMIAFVGLAFLLIVLPRLNKRFEFDIAAIQLSTSASSHSISSLAANIGKSGRSFVERIDHSIRGSQGGFGSSRGSMGRNSDLRGPGGDKGFQLSAAGGARHNGSAGAVHPVVQDHPRATPEVAAVPSLA